MNNWNLLNEYYLKNKVVVSNLIKINCSVLNIIIIFKNNIFLKLIDENIKNININNIDVFLFIIIKNTFINNYEHNKKYLYFLQNIDKNKISKNELLQIYKDKSDEFNSNFNKFLKFKINLNYYDDINFVIKEEKLTAEMIKNNMEKYLRKLMGLVIKKYKKEKKNMNFNILNKQLRNTLNKLVKK